MHPSIRARHRLLIDFSITFVFLSAQNDDLDRVEILIRNGVSANAEDSAGYTPLHYAARNAHHRVCEVLLLHGADVNARTRCGRATALHRAATQGHVDVVQLLLRHGANANLVDADSNTALHRALASASASALTVCELLIPRTDLTITNGFGRSAKQLIRENFFVLMPLLLACESKENEDWKGGLCATFLLFFFYRNG